MLPAWDSNSKAAPVGINDSLIAANDLRQSRRARGLTTAQQRLESIYRPKTVAEVDATAIAESSRDFSFPLFIDSVYRNVTIEVRRIDLLPIRKHQDRSHNALNN